MRYTSAEKKRPWQAERVARTGRKSVRFKFIKWERQPLLIARLGGKFQVFPGKLKGHMHFVELVLLRWG